MLLIRDRFETRDVYTMFQGFGVSVLDLRPGIFVQSVGFVTFLFNILFVDHRRYVLVL